MAGLESILAALAQKMTGKAPTANTVEGILQFIVDNYTAGGGGGGG